MAKPFDLKKAKAGAKVIWRGTTVNYIGTSVHDASLHVIETNPNDAPNLTSIWYVNECDLTMAPVKVVKYVNLYRETNISGEYSMYESKDVAVEAGIRCGACVVAYPIEVEE